MTIALWIIGILLFISVWISLDYVLGRRNHLKHVVSKDFPIRESNLDIFTSGPELFEDLFTEIKKAKKHVHIIFYIVKNDQFSQEFISLLKEKVREGVEVRLMADWVGSKSLTRSMVKEMEQAGIEFAYCHVPRFPYLFYTLQVRNHRKITVIDGKVGYLGGFNIGKEYINQDTKLNPWRDYHLKMIGEGVQDLQTEFLLDWEEEKKINLRNNSIYFPKLEKGRLPHRIVPSEGKYLERQFAKLIETAKSSIMIGTPYFIPSSKVFAKLRNALKRGVKLTILVPEQADHALVKEGSFCYLRKLIKEGADVYQFQNGFYHAKVIIIDEELCDIGTANFDKRSMFLNHEINCFIFDKSFVEKAVNVLKADISKSAKMSLQKLNQPNFLRSLKEAAARSVSFFL